MVGVHRLFVYGTLRAEVFLGGSGAGDEQPWG